MFGNSTPLRSRAQEGSTRTDMQLRTLHGSGAHTGEGEAGRTKVPWHTCCFAPPVASRFVILRAQLCTDAAPRWAHVSTVALDTRCGRMSHSGGGGARASPPGTQAGVRTQPDRPGPPRWRAGRMRGARARTRRKLTPASGGLPRVRCPPARRRRSAESPPPTR